jgi:hypothetical protein
MLDLKWGCTVHHGKGQVQNYYYRGIKKKTTVKLSSIVLFKEHDRFVKKPIECQDF